MLSPLKSCAICCAAAALAGCGGVGVYANVLPGLSLGVGLDNTGRVTGHLAAGAGHRVGEHGYMGLSIGRAWTLRQPDAAPPSRWQNSEAACTGANPPPTAVPETLRNAFAHWPWGLSDPPLWNRDCD